MMALLLDDGTTLGSIHGRGIGDSSDKIFMVISMVEIIMVLAMMVVVVSIVIMALLAVLQLVLERLW